MCCNIFKLKRKKVRTNELAFSQLMFEDNTIPEVVTMQPTVGTETLMLARLNMEDRALVGGWENSAEASTSKGKSSVRRTLQAGMAVFQPMGTESNLRQPSFYTGNMTDKALLECDKLPTKKCCSQGALAFLQPCGNTKSGGSMTAQRNSTTGSKSTQAAALAKGSDARAPHSIGSYFRKGKALQGTGICKYCCRHFQNNRLKKHEEVCQKVSSKKRNAFESSKQRIQGTELEKYQKKPVALPATANCRPATQQNGPIKYNWRLEHEELVSTLQNSRKYEQLVKKGGKIGDIPPPPPMKNPDYIQCPHCERRFGVRAADRHIAFCASQKLRMPRTKPATASTAKKNLGVTKPKAVTGKGRNTL